MKKRQTIKLYMCRMICMQTCMRCIMLSSKRESEEHMRIGV